MEYFSSGFRAEASIQRMLELDRNAKAQILPVTGSKTIRTVSKCSIDRDAGSNSACGRFKPHQDYLKPQKGSFKSHKEKVNKRGLTPSV